MWCITNMTIHTVRLDIITTIEQHRRDTTTIITTDRRHLTTIRIMAIAISRSDHLISIDLIAINHSDHSRSDLHNSDQLHRSVTTDLPQQEVVDKKYSENKKK
jgi:hypothetical protein